MLMPEFKAPAASWLAWVNSEYPFDERWEKYLRKRQPHQRAPVGHSDELKDLCGLRDRALAANLAAIWAKINPIAAAAVRRGEKFEPEQPKAVQQLPVDPSDERDDEWNPDNWGHYEQQELGL